MGLENDRSVRMMGRENDSKSGDEGFRGVESDVYPYACMFYARVVAFLG